MRKKISIEEAAKILHMCPSKLRRYMRNGVLDIGLAIPPEKTGKEQWEYIIFPAKLEKMIGGKIEYE